MRGSEIHQLFSRQRWPLLGLGLLLVAGPLALADIWGWSQGALAVLSGFLLVATILGSRQERLPHVQLAVLGLGIAVAWVGIQAFPLPCRWVELVSPTAARTQEQTFGMLGMSDWRCTISYAPADSRRVLLQDLAAFCVLLASIRLSQYDRGKRVGTLLGISSAAMIAVVAAHWLTNASSVFGLYAPRQVRPTVLAPLLNVNILAGYLSFGAPLLIWTMCRRRSTLLKVSACVTVCLSGLVVGASGSRAGVVSFALATVTALFCFRPKILRRRQLLAAVPPLLACGAAAVLVFRAKNDAAKWKLIGSALRFASEVPLVGVGRGAFSAAYVGTADSPIRVSHGENLVADYGAQLGMPMFALLVVVIVVSCATRVAQLREAKLAALIALVALGLHDLADFALQMPGVELCAAAALGMVLSSRGKPGSTGEPGESTWYLPRFTLLTVASVTVAAAILWTPGLDASSLSSHRVELMAARSRNPADFQLALRSALVDHPTEPLFPLIAAAQAVDRRSVNAPVWLNRAMALAPSWPGPHVEAARWLLTLGRDSQAALELRLAAEADLQIGAEATCEIVRRWRHPHLVMAAAPSGSGRAAFLNLGVRCLDANDPVQLAVDAQVTPADDPDVILRQSSRLRASGAQGQAERLLRAAYRLNPSRPDLLVTLCEILIEAGRIDEAVQLATVPGALQRSAVLQVKARAFAASGQADRMRSAVDDLQREHYTSSSEGASVLVLLGELEERLMQPERALAAYERALWLSSTPELRWRYAALAEKSHDFARARDAYRALCDGPPAKPAACAKLANLPAQMMEQLKRTGRASLGSGDP